MTQPLTPDLLQTLQGAGDPQAAMLNMLAASGRLSPQQQALLQSMMPQHEADTDAPGNVIDHEDIPPMLPPDITRLITAARERLGLLEGVLESVGDALGACPVCLGADGDCDTCGGDGHPGTWRPDAEAFTHLVLPAIRRLKRPQRRKAVGGSTVADRETSQATSNLSKTGKE